MFSFSHDEVEYKMPKFSAAEFFLLQGILELLELYRITA
jgi:hypothetical protein